MKIIQSFWSGQNNNIEDNRGWLSYEYHWLGWILSCNQLRKFYDDVELYTDLYGYKILIEKLKLPYTKVHVVLDEMNHYPKDLWAVAKIRTYKLQERPFLHIDGDVFVWNRFSDDFLKSNIIAQNLEHTTDYYREMWNNIAPHLRFIPEEINNYHTEKITLGCNMGIVGGNDISFFQKYTQKSLEFVDRNSEVWGDFNLFNFNIFFEQELFFEMCQIEKKNINYLFDEVWGDNSYLGLGNFQDIPHKRFYLHLLGDFKRRLTICKNLEAYVLKEYPEYFHNLKTILTQKYNEFEQVIPFYDFTKKSNQKIVAELKKELKFKNSEINNIMLFGRDLLIPSLYKELDERLGNGEDFTIILLKCFELEKTENYENQENKNLLVKQWDGSIIKFDFDEIDLLLVGELKDPITKKKLLNNMLKYIDDNFSPKDLQEFILLLENRLKYFLECKIILIEDLV